MLIVEYLVALVSVFIPVILVIAIGPEITKKRLSFMATGMGTAIIIGTFLSTIAINSRFSNLNSFWAVMSVGLLSGVVEEIFRYPSVLLANFFGSKTDRNVNVQNNNSQWSTIKDGHGLAIYFGVGWGMYESFLYYIIPTIERIIMNEELVFLREAHAITYRVTAVMAHIALTYLSLIITVNRSFYRFTILLHMGTNFIVASFTFISVNLGAEALFVLFSRFALVVVIFYFLRPKARYYTPALLLFVEVLLFMLFILFGTFIYLFSVLLNVNIFSV